MSTSEAVRARRAEGAAHRAERSVRQESYARAMLLGYEALQASDYGLVQELLAQTRKSGTEEGDGTVGPAQPAWEWRHLLYETRDESSSLLPSAEVIWSLAVSPDGQWLAAGGAGGTTSFWRLPLRNAKFESSLGDEITYVCFSPDSQQVAVGGAGGTVWVLAVSSGLTLSKFRLPTSILALRFSPDGQRLAFCSENGFGIFNRASQTLERSESQPRASRAVISEDGQWVVRTTRLEGIIVSRTGTNVFSSELDGTGDDENVVQISPDGQWLATELADHSIQVWALPQFRPVHKLVEHVKALGVIAWSADSRWLASGGTDQTICVWDPQGGRLLRRLRGHQGTIHGLAFSPDNQALFSGGEDNAIRVCTSFTNKPPPQAVPTLPHLGWAKFAPGARFLSTVGTPGCRIFELLPAWKFYDVPVVGPCGVSGDGRQLAVVHGNLCELWLRQSDGYRLQSSYPALTNATGVPVFSSDSRRVALLARDGTFGVWQVQPWRPLAQWHGAESSDRGFVFDPPGKRLFLGCYDGGVLAGDVESGRLIRFPTQTQERDHHVSSLDVSADNRLVVTANYNGIIVLWAFAPGEEPHSLGTLPRMHSGTWSVAFSPDCRRLAIGSYDGDIQLWDVRRRMLVGVLKGHRRPVKALAFSLADDTLVSVSADEVHIWRAASVPPETNP